MKRIKAYLMKGPTLGDFIILVVVFGIFQFALKWWLT